MAQGAGPVDVFTAVAVRRRAVADLLEALDDEQLATPSLCAGWDVRTVGAHLAEAASPGGLGPFLLSVVRAGGRIHRANDLAARRASRRPVAETVALLRERAESRFTPPVTGPRAPLTEVLVHEGDMRVPLGLPLEPEAPSVRTALEFVTTGRPVGFVPRGRLRGLRLAATDLDWSWGTGAEVSGRGIDLLLAGCGRTAVLQHLQGPGRQVLTARLSGAADQPAGPGNAPAGGNTPTPPAAVAVAAWTGSHRLRVPGPADGRDGRLPMTLCTDPSTETTPTVEAAGTTGTTAASSTARPQTPSMGRTALVLGAFVAVGPLTIDMYLPALPTITTQLQTTQAAVQLTLTGTLVGLALGQLVIGPLSDALGRRRPLLAGTALHVVASLLVMVAPNVAVLGALRVLQGVGTAAGAVVALAIVRDLYDGRAAATMLSRLFLVMGAAPVLAPTLGGEVLRFTSWRGVFAVLALYGVALLAMGARALRETLAPEARSPLHLRATARTYRGLLRDRSYIGLVLVAGLTMAGLFGYVAGASFVYQGQFGLDQQQFGLLFGAGAVWLIAATQLNPLVLRRFAPSQVLLAGTLAGLLAGAVLLVLAASGTGGLVGVVVPLWAVLFSCGLALPNAPALALSRHGEAAGAAAALLGAVQFGVGALVSPLVGLLGNDARSMGFVILAALALGTAVLVLVVRPWQLVDADGSPAVAGH